MKSHYKSHTRSPQTRFHISLFVLLTSLLSGCNQILPQPETTPAAIPETVLAPAPVAPLAPAPECEVTAPTLAAFEPEHHGNLWDRLRAGYQLDVVMNERVKLHLDWYARHQGYMNRISERASRYLFHIVEELEARELPLELALLPIVESAFDPFAYSHGRASGMWQFIPATGRQYGLEQNWWYDGRRDIEASTQAAINYLSDLHRRFKGDWLLALAAYNTGEGNLQRAIRRNRRQGKATDFWALKLPRETRAYVPQLLALAVLVGDPAQHQISLKEIPNRPYFTRVNVNSQIDLAQAATLAEIDIDELYLLNPGYNRWATDPQGSHHLLLPVAEAERFSAKLQALPRDERIGWERYIVKSGDSLLIIARHFNTSVESLKKANSLRGNVIRVGQPLLIPVATQPAKHYAFSADQRLRRKQARSRGGEGTARVSYRVQPGDSFWKIARRHNIQVKDIARWNGMAPKDLLHPGQELVLWTRPGREAQRPVARLDNPVIRKVAYRVRRGDSLARIAGKFNLSVKDILSWNTLNKSKYIHPGQSLTLFVDVTQVN
ncbi:LysM peptidoglycan-binding domain-containing protein [Exilibacterium tricleocarpae]|uniref:LysM peptidoglycan-binding domain-containing protein n=1 Tax=Exilibacterium tricleocarpae TaxID=2591008 RepID=A0A545TVP7_9GAMM|nr:LysM peptidoglycan-binding domain-containing protein [Exilibacterium tricleocarpae]TQV81299.1 LysM peptidoglycan-binding domain-containing protein [Exilibacterium tricleocarpae]